MLRLPRVPMAISRCQCRWRRGAKDWRGTSLRRRARAQVRIARAPRAARTSARDKTRRTSPSARRPTPPPSPSPPPLPPPRPSPEDAARQRHLTAWKSSGRAPDSWATTRTGRESSTVERSRGRAEEGEEDWRAKAVGRGARRARALCAPTRTTACLCSRGFASTESARRMMFAAEMIALRRQSAGCVADNADPLATASRTGPADDQSRSTYTSTYTASLSKALRRKRRIEGGTRLVVSVG